MHGYIIIIRNLVQQISMLLGFLHHEKQIKVIQVLMSGRSLWVYC